MEEKDLLVFLHIQKGIGWKTIFNIFQYMDDIKEIFFIQPLEFSMRTGIKYSLAEKIINQLKKEYLDEFPKQKESWEKAGIEIITFLDQNYPERLKEIQQPPWVLFAIGNTELFNHPSLAVVGTRNPTPYGKWAAEKLTGGLVEYDWTIVSGMARGIDYAAHESALRNNGKTIAVLGNGVDVIYPQENRKLYKEIADKGLILSEYPPKTQPHPGYFPQRNRIISGLSYGSIIIEASKQSGSLITAQYALEQSREVFAVPGPIHSKHSLGSNSLIKQGAKLVQDIEDIVEEFPYLKLKKRVSNQRPEMTNQREEAVHQVIQYQPVHINDIYNQTEIELNQIYETLLSLQLKRKIKQLPGGFYIRQD